MAKVAVEEFNKILPAICDADTSASPDEWKPDNPLWGHCAVISLVAQNLFGGELMRGSLEGTPFTGMRSHYWNRLPAGDTDFSAAQFGGQYPTFPKVENRTRASLLSNASTLARYKLLAWRFVKIISGDNPLFHDFIYFNCFNAALESTCQKMSFGATIIYQTENLAAIIYTGCNRAIEPLQDWCEPTCVRLAIPSRTQSMIGACGHAEERGLWQIAKQRAFSLDKCELYVAGLHNGLPSIKDQPEFSCIRCAVAIYYANIQMVYMPVGDRWIGLTPEEALKSARLYAAGVKKT